MLNQLETIPYQLELRDTLDAAMYYFGELEKVAAQALAAQDQSAAAQRLTQELLNRQGHAQRLVFDHLDAFHGAFARVSLLIFPASKTPFAELRGTTMQTCLSLDQTSILADRELRGSWMHHDERIDWAVQNKVGRSGQVFSRSTDNPAAKLNAFLRVIELDTLVVHYRDRSGTPKRANVRQLAAALTEVDTKRIDAFRTLPVPDDA